MLTARKYERLTIFYGHVVEETYPEVYVAASEKRTVVRISARPRPYYFTLSLADIIADMSKHIFNKGDMSLIGKNVILVVGTYKNAKFGFREHEVKALLVGEDA